MEYRFHHLQNYIPTEFLMVQYSCPLSKQVFSLLSILIWMIAYILNGYQLPVNISLVLLNQITWPAVVHASLLEAAASFDFFVLFCLQLFPPSFPALAHQKNVASYTLLSCRWNRPLVAFLLTSKNDLPYMLIMLWFLTIFFYKSLTVLTQFNSGEWLLFYGSKA